MVSGPHLILSTGRALQLTCDPPPALTLVDLVTLLVTQEDAFEENRLPTEDEGSAWGYDKSHSANTTACHVRYYLKAQARL